MASDPNIDLIVVCVEVKLRAEFVKSAINHGRRVYYEWPFGRNFEEANELATLAAERESKRTLVLKSPLSGDC
jgi:predicted dehydrogenase